MKKRFFQKHSYLCKNEFFYIFSKKLKYLAILNKIIIIPVKCNYFSKILKRFFSKNIVICVLIKFIVFLQNFEKYFCFFQKLRVISVNWKLLNFIKKFKKIFFLKKHSYLCKNEIYYIFSKKLKNIRFFESNHSYPCKMKFIYIFENEKSQNIVICVKIKFTVFFPIFGKYFCLYQKF